MISFLLLCSSSLYCSEQVVSPSFIELMGKPGLNYEATTLSPKDEEELRYLEKRYNEKKDLLLQPSSTQHIPKIIHFIWIGPKNVSQKSLLLLQSWKTLHPDWELCFWTDIPRELPIDTIKTHLVSELDLGKMQGLFDASDNLGEKADILRYAILLQKGGIYADMDVLCIRSFKPFVDTFDFVIGLERSHYHPSIDSSIIPSNALIASIPGHPIIQNTIDRMLAIWDKVGKRYSGTDRKNVFNRVIQRTFDSLAICCKEQYESSTYQNLILPASYFHSQGPFSSEEQASYTDRGFVYAIHQSHPSGTYEQSEGGSWLPVLEK